MTEKLDKTEQNKKIKEEKTGQRTENMKSSKLTVLLSSLVLVGSFVW